MIQRPLATLGRLGAAAALGLWLAAPAHAQNPTEKSFQQARAALDAALKAAGGAEALRAVKDVTRTGKGSAYSLGQSLKPEGPLLKRELEITAVSDLAGRRSAVDTFLARTELSEGVHRFEGGSPRSSATSASSRAS